VAALALYPYQQQGVDFLLRRPVELNRKPHRLLADEQGLGKTVQVIAAMAHLGASSGLIICPASVKYNWARQMVAWGLCNENSIQIIRTGKDTLGYAPFVVVNYDLAIVPAINKQLAERLYIVGVLDEVQRLKNMRSKRSKLILGAKLGVIKNCWWKFLLSGTPVPNRPIEFYALLKTLAPECIAPFTKWVDFGRRFCSGFEAKFGETDPETGKKWSFNGASNIDELSDRLAPFMLRRELKDVYRQLPDMVEEVVYLDVDINQHPEVIEQQKDQRVARTEAFDAELEMPQATIRRIIGESKIPQTVDYIRDYLPTMGKVLVFAYHREVVGQIARQLSDDGTGVLIIQGGVSSELKDKFVQDFINNPEQKVLVAQITAGGEAIDGLQKVCSNVIFAELDWSEGGMRQAKSRLHRIGQTEIVKVKYLIAGNSLETVMAATLERKSSVINRLVKGTITMSIEQSLERIAVALEAIAGGAQPAAAVAEKPKADKPKAEKPKADKPAGPSIDDVKAAAKNFVDKLGGTQAQAKQIIKDLCGGALKDLPEAQYAEAIEAFKVAPAAEETGDDDL